MARPFHKHDCGDCIFLGLFFDERYTYDLYYCSQNNNVGHWRLTGSEVIPTVIARYGSDSDYKSGMALVGIDKVLTDAAKRAIEMELLDSNAKTGCADGRTIQEAIDQLADKG